MEYIGWYGNKKIIGYGKTKEEARLDCVNKLWAAAICDSVLISIKG